MATKARATVRNNTIWTSKSVRALVKRTLEELGYDRLPWVLVVRHPEKGKRIRRAKFTQQHDFKLYYYFEMTVPRSMGSATFCAELGWEIYKGHGDKPGQYLPMVPVGALRLEPKPDTKPKRDLMRERRDHAQTQVKRLEKEIDDLKKAILRKRINLAKWRKKERKQLSRLSARPARKKLEKVKREDEKAWRGRVKSKSQALQEAGTNQQEREDHV